MLQPEEGSPLVMTATERRRLRALRQVADIAQRNRIRREDHARLLLKYFRRWHLRGLSQRQIIDRLNAEHFVTPRQYRTGKLHYSAAGGPKWSLFQFQRMRDEVERVMKEEAHEAQRKRARRARRLKRKVE